MSTDGEVEQPVQPGTVEGVEVPQPQVAMPVDDEAHQPPRPKHVEATTDEDVQSARLTQTSLRRVLLPQMCR